MKLLFPYVDKSNYKQCISFLENHYNWEIVCVISSSKFLALSQEQIDNITRLAHTVTYEYTVPVDYIIPVWPDMFTEQFHTLSKSTKYVTPLSTYNKQEIYKHANSVGIMTPTVYTDNHTYPLIAKPIIGTGALGVKLINNDYQYSNFFNEIDKPDDYFDLGSTYQKEEYIEGTVSTIMGCILNGKMFLGPIYDIDSNIDEYFTTTKATLPSTQSLDYFIDKIPRLLQIMNIDNSPFILDVINGTHLIDFSCRIGGNELTHSLCNDWGVSVVKSIVDNIPLEYSMPKHHYIFQSLPFQKGTIIDYQINNDLTARSVLPEVKTFYKAKNLNSLLDRGYIVVMGDSFNEANDKLNKTLNSFTVNYKHDTTTHS